MILQMSAMRLVTTSGGVAHPHEPKDNGCLGEESAHDGEGWCYQDKHRCCRLIFRIWNILNVLPKPMFCTGRNERRAYYGEDLMSHVSVSRRVVRAWGEDRTQPPNMHQSSDPKEAVAILTRVKTLANMKNVENAHSIHPTRLSV